MNINIIRKGRYKIVVDNIVVSEHNEEKDAIENLFNQTYNNPMSKVELIPFDKMVCDINDEVINDKQVFISSEAELEHALENAMSGDIFVIKDGIYNIPIKILDKNFSENVSFIAENPRNVTITGTSKSRVVRLSNSSNISFDGIVFDGGVWTVCMGAPFSSDTDEGCSDISFHNCEMKNSSQSIIKINRNSSYIKISNCEIHNSGMDISDKPYAEGIYIGDGNAKNDRSNNITIENCHIYDIGNYDTNVGGEAIDIKVQCHNIYILDNIIDNITVYSQGAITVLTNNVDYPEDYRNPNIIIYGNTVSNVRRTSNGWNGSGIAVGANGISIENNKVSNCEESSLTITSDAGNTIDHVTLQGNVFEKTIINESNIEGEPSIVNVIYK